MNPEQTSKSVDLSTPTTKILAIGRLTEKGLDPGQRVHVMPREVPATVNLYLSGIIEQWWVKPDGGGVVFVLNLTDVDEANRIMESLPLGLAGMMAFDFIPLGPLTPLRFLLGEVAATSQLTE